MENRFKLKDKVRLGERTGFYASAALTSSQKGN